MLPKIGKASSKIPVEVSPANTDRQKAASSQAVQVPDTPPKTRPTSSGVSVEVTPIKKGKRNAAGWLDGYPCF